MPVKVHWENSFTEVMKHYILLGVQSLFMNGHSLSFLVCGLFRHLSLMHENLRNDGRNFMIYDADVIQHHKDVS